MKLPEPFDAWADADPSYGARVLSLSAAERKRYLNERLVALGGAVGTILLAELYSMDTSPAMGLTGAALMVVGLTGYAKRVHDLTGERTSMLACALASLVVLLSQIATKVEVNGLVALAVVCGGAFLVGTSLRRHRDALAAARADRIGDRT